MRIFANPNYNFLKWRWHALIASVIIIWAGVASIYFHHGLQMGIEFTGGTELVIHFDTATDEQHVRAAIDPISRDAVVQKHGSPEQHEISVRLQDVPGQTDALDADAARVQAALTAAHLGTFKIIGKNVVGPVVGEELRTKGIWTVVASLGGILLYVMFRFRFTFAVGAIVAAFHDILITLVMLSWFHYDMTLNVIAGILTITGYSVNDTIVIFDRVRENMRSKRREPLEQVVNTAVNQTLGRTIITAGTAFLSVLALFLFGGEALHGFAFTMLVGIVSGTYSTVFIASAIAIILSRKPGTATAAASASAETAARKQKGAKAS
jgi:preprotein translocase subunit SecF